MALGAILGVNQNLTAYLRGKLLAFSVTAAVFVWDSQVQDGYKREQNHQEADGVSSKGPCSAPMGWDGKRSCDVVQELLKNSSDKAYGTESELCTKPLRFLEKWRSSNLDSSNSKLVLQAFRMKTDDLCFCCDAF